MNSVNHSSHGAVFNQSIIRENQVIQITGLSRSTIWRQEKEGTFPRRRKLSHRAVGWLKSEILFWLESRGEVGSS